MNNQAKQLVFEKINEQDDNLHDFLLTSYLDIAVKMEDGNVVLDHIDGALKHSEVDSLAILLECCLKEYSRTNPGILITGSILLDEGFDIKYAYRDGRIANFETAQI